MKTTCVRTAALVAVFVLVGCSRDVDPIKEDVETRLGDTTDVDVAAWLKLSRPELAKLSAEWAAAVKSDLQAARQAPDAIDMLPQLFPPVRVPIFRQATFSPSAGFSLPPYLKEGVRDEAVAVHLARFGDHEAAEKLNIPGTEAQKRIDALRYEKSYPLEWSRLVGLVLASSQFKLAGGNPEAAARLVLVHQQLLKTLDKRAAAGPLGSVLLPAGKRALTLAAKAWREPSRKKIALADDIDNALAEWGAVPGPMPGLVPGATKEAVASVFGLPMPGKAVIVQKPEEMARPLDLMAMPVPSDALAVLAAFLDDKNLLAEIQFTYRAKIEDILPEPIHLAFYLDELGATLKGQDRDASLDQRTYVVGGLRFEAMRTNRSNALGGWVRVTAASNPAKTASTHTLRTFGPVHLDRGFETNRVALAPNVAGPTAFISDKAALKRLTPGLEIPTPAAAELECAKDLDVVAGLRLTWNVDQNTKALSELLPALWSAFGNPQVQAADDATGAYLAFTWQDNQTRAQLRLPFDEKGPLLLVEDTRGKDKLGERAEAARRADQAERKARLEAGKPEVRLARSPGTVNNFSLEGLRLGQTKAEAEAALPTGKGYRRKAFPGGLSLLVLTPTTKGASFWARQVILRYDDKERLTEIRLRYLEDLAPARKGEKLLDTLCEGKAGAPEPTAASWKDLWADLPRSRVKPVEARWMDDLTICTYRKDAYSSEVILADRGADEKQTAPLRFVKAGVLGCNLGDTKEAVKAALKAPVQTTPRGADVHRAPADSPYEMVLVWYKDGKVSRIRAVHRIRPGGEDREVAAALSEAWGRDIDNLGSIRRQEGQRAAILGSYFWHDDSTRVEMFVQSTDQGPRLMTEIIPWPPVNDKAAAQVRAGDAK